MSRRVAAVVHTKRGWIRLWWTALLLLAPPAPSARAASEDPRDLLVIMPALNDALENERSGKDIGWTNSATGRAGSIRVERTFYRGLQPCREYARTTSGSGPGYEVRGTGCRIGKLNWTVEERRIDDPSPAASAPPVAAAPAAAPAAPPSPPDPSTTGSRDAARSGDPSSEPAPTRPPRKAAPPPPPSLSYGLPTRSQL
jgi:hypothetical protein